MNRTELLPEVVVFTHLGLDHTEFVSRHRATLQNWLEEIVLCARTRREYLQRILFEYHESGFDCFEISNYMISNETMIEVVDFGADAFSNAELLHCLASTAAVGAMVAQSSDFWSPAWDKALRRLPDHNLVRDLIETRWYYK